MTSWRVILGTSITCSGTMVSSGLSTSTSHRLLHRSIEDLHHGSKFGRLLHGAPLDLRPQRLCQAGRQPPAGLFFVEAEELRLKRSLPDLGRVVQLALILSGPGLPSVPVGLSGVTTWPGPQRSTDARVATTSAVVAACDAEQRSWPAPLGSIVNKCHKKKGTLGINACCCC